jgi:hypothetical protein
MSYNRKSDKQFLLEDEDVATLNNLIEYLYNETFYDDVSQCFAEFLREQLKKFKTTDKHDEILFHLEEVANAFFNHMKGKHQPSEVILARLCFVCECL